MASDRILSLRLQRKEYYDQKVERYLSFKGNRINFNDQNIDNFLSILPEFWNTSKDKLLYFVYFSDHSFLCQRSKEVFNFSTKETEEKLYNFNAATSDQVREFVQYLENYFIQQKTKEVNDFYDKVIENLSDVSYIKYQILDLRKNILSETDYMFNSDYSFKEESDSIVWKEYRQKWRDITEQEAWINNDFLNIKIPVSPKPKEQMLEIFANIGNIFSSSDIPQSIIDAISNFTSSEYGNGGLDSVIENFVAITLKVEILNSFSKIKMPIGYSITDINEVENYILSSQDITAEEITNINTNDLSLYLSNIQDKIDEINEKLQNYNIGFTLSDIVQKFAEDLKEKALQKEAEQQAIELLENISLEESINGGNS